MVNFGEHLAGRAESACFESVFIIYAYIDSVHLSGMEDWPILLNERRVSWHWYKVWTCL